MPCLVTFCLITVALLMLQRDAVAGWHLKMSASLTGILTMTTTQSESSVRVTRDSVLEVIKSYVEAIAPHFTTHDIARHMGIDEYPVRAAFTWLNRNNVIAIVPGVRSKRYLPVVADQPRRWHCESYNVNVYQLCEQPAEVDFAALNRAFGFA